MSSQPDSPFLRFLVDVHVYLADVRDADKAVRIALRHAREAFGADEACLATHSRGESRTTLTASVPGAAQWDGLPFWEFLHGRRPRLEPTVLMVAIERRGGPWGVLALRNRERPFSRGALKDAGRIGPVLSSQLQRLDLMRIAEVRAKIDRKMMEQPRPKDLCYQILHGLRTLTRYDHSAAVLLYEGSDRLEVVAEQIAWGKHRSQAMGTVVTLSDEARRLLGSDEVYGFEWEADRWRDWRGRGAAALAGLLHFDAVGEREQELSVLCAPLSTKGELLGVLKIASRHPGGLGPYEADLVKHFMPQASIVMRNLRRTFLRRRSS